MPSLRRQFGKRIKGIRRERRLTQEKFAELVDISVDFLSLIERGLNSPSFEKLEQMAHILKMPVRDLFDFRKRLETASGPAKSERKGAPGSHN